MGRSSIATRGSGLSTLALSRKQLQQLHHQPQGPPFVCQKRLTSCCRCSICSLSLCTCSMLSCVCAPCVLHVLRVCSMCSMSMCAPHVLCVHLVYLVQGQAYQLLLITTEQKWYLLCSATAKQRAALADWAKKMTIAPGFKAKDTCPAATAQKGEKHGYSSVRGAPMLLCNC